MDRATPTPPCPSNPTPNSSLPSPPSAPSFTPAPPTLPPPPKTLSRALLFQAAGAGGLAALAFLGTPLITNYYGSLPTGPATIEAAATFAPEVHANAIQAANAHCCFAYTPAERIGAILQVVPLAGAWQQRASAHGVLVW